MIAGYVCYSGILLGSLATLAMAERGDAATFASALDAESE